MNKQKALLITVLVFAFVFTATATFAALTFSSTTITSSGDLTIDASGADVTPLTIKTNGSPGNYTPANSAIFIKDAAGTEILRIFGSDPDDNNFNSDNLYIGKKAGFSQPTDNVDAGYYNTGIGSSALYSNTTGTNNSALGEVALYDNTTGSYNSALGYGSLGSNTSGDYNSAFGVYDTLYDNTTGSYNSAFGRSALANNTTGSNNTAIGVYALYLNDTGSGNVALGYSAGNYETGSNAFYVDNQDRTNTAGDKAGALLYGTFNATPANQTLTINARITASNAKNKGTVALSGGTATVTVASGAVCVVSETTDATKTVKGAVSGTTLTITGTGTDTIAYICL